jgi:hypothetical protein
MLRKWACIFRGITIFSKVARSEKGAFLSPARPFSDSSLNGSHHRDAQDGHLSTVLSHPVEAVQTPSNVAPSSPSANSHPSAEVPTVEEIEGNIHTPILVGLRHAPLAQNAVLMLRGPKNDAAKMLPLLIGNTFHQNAKKKSDTPKKHAIYRCNQLSPRA